MPHLALDDLNLAAAERRLCIAALEQGGNIVNAAKLLGITRHALKRRIIKLRISWPQPAPQVPVSAPSISPSA
jgi:transcriptional regulator with GAF, ATPase, and Fis domain